jgi:O-antigen/teichoic acid export membrane protein
VSAETPAAAPAAAGGRGAGDGEPRGLRGLLKDSALYGLGAIASRFVGFLLLPVYTRLFAPAEYGVLDLLTTTSVVLFMLAELQIVSGVARGYYAARDRGELPVLMGTAVRLYLRNALAWTALAPLALWLLDEPLAAVGGWTVFLPVVAALVPQQLFGLSQLVFRFERRPRLYVAFSLGDVATSALFSIGAVVWLGMGVGGVLWGLFLSKLVWGAAAVWVRRGVYAWRYDPAHARALLGYGLPLVPSVLSKWGQNYANRYVLAFSLSMADLGVFGVAARLAAVVAILDTAFRTSWDPMAMRLFEEEGSEPVFDRVLGMYLAAMFALCGVLAFAGAPVARLVAGPGYEAAGPLLGFLGFGLLWNGATGIIGAGNAWARRTYWNTLGFVAGGALNLALLAWAAPRWGVQAAGATYVLGSMASAAVILATGQRSHPIPFRRLPLALAAVGSLAVPTVAYLLDGRGLLAGFSTPAAVGVRALLAAAVALPPLLVLARSGGLARLRRP